MQPPFDELAEGDRVYLVHALAAAVTDTLARAGWHVTHAGAAEAAKNVIADLFGKDR